MIGAALGGGALWLYCTDSHEIRWSDGVAIAVALICFVAATSIATAAFVGRGKTAAWSALALARTRERR